MSFTPSNILISRTDAIGDVVLTLPVARVLKERFPQAVIGFLAKPYTHAVLEACPYVDEIVSPQDAIGVTNRTRWGNTIHMSQGAQIAAWAKWDTIIHVLPDARIAAWANGKRIPVRIGTTNRIYHWWTCNRLVRLSRKRSDLHEAQLNLKLLEALGIDALYSLDALRNMTLLKPLTSLPGWLQAPLGAEKKHIILHPTSMGSAREWGLENFATLSKMLIEEGHTVFITGTEKDSAKLQPFLAALGNAVNDVTGRLSLPELIAFIAACDGLVAASTGPLHLAAALGRAAVGLYPAERPMHPGRWAPLGRFATWLTAAPVSSKKENVLEGISPKDVFAALQRQLSLKLAAAEANS